MIVYLSVPYTVRKNTTQQDAVNTLLRLAGTIYKASPDVTPVSGVLNWYNQIVPHHEHETYAYAKALIDSCALLSVVRAPGWEYSDIVQQEAAYASLLNKPITYIDP